MAPEVRERILRARRERQAAEREAKAAAALSAANAVLKQAAARFRRAERTADPERAGRLRAEGEDKLREALRFSASLWPFDWHSMARRVRHTDLWIPTVGPPLASGDRFRWDGGLWEAARETAEDALARLAIVPMVLEARALDITPGTVTRFEEVGDMASGRILRRIVTDEIRHVAAGTNWFNWATNRRGLTAPAHYQMLVKRHFRGSLKPPFNDSARRQAGLTEEFYAALAS